MLALKFAHRDRVSAAVVGLAVAAILTGCGGIAGSSSTAAGAVNVTAYITQFNGADRQASPGLSGTTLDGKAYSTAYSGHVTVINVWGSWCTACREEAAAFSETYQKYKAKGVRFLGIDTMDPSIASALAYDSYFGIAYPSLQDPDETLLLDLKSFLTTADVPSTLIVDASGKVAVRALGATTEPELEQEINYVSSGS